VAVGPTPSASSVPSKGSSRSSLDGFTIQPNVFQNPERDEERTIMLQFRHALRVGITHGTDGRFEAFTVTYCRTDASGQERRLTGYSCDNGQLDLEHFDEAGNIAKRHTDRREAHCHGLVSHAINKLAERWQYALVSQ
jgi:hypothetical protein